VVEALVSVTGVKDNVGDIIVPGAYTKTLKERKPKGAWAHEWQTPVSKVREIKELLPGDTALPKTLSNGDPWPEEAGALYVKAEFNLNTTAGKDAYENVKFFGEDCEWSIGYKVPRGGATKDTKTGIRHIKELNLFEFSPVLFGAASEARSLTSASIKSMQFDMWDEEKDDEAEIENKDADLTDEPEIEAKDDEVTDEEMIAVLAEDAGEGKTDERSESREVVLSAVVIDQIKALQEQLNAVMEVALSLKTEEAEVEPVEVPSKTIAEAVADIIGSDSVELDQKVLFHLMRFEHVGEAEKKDSAIKLLDSIDTALDNTDAEQEMLLKTLAKSIGDSLAEEKCCEDEEDAEESVEEEVTDEEKTETPVEEKKLSLTPEEFAEFKKLLG
jgi:HK97 family phage prohead protease